ncbi:hypothetical protein C1637_12390 [Chryseobacterium lactis]|uniref:DUF3329 domain-containing protein n=1 Tax=Chryseobacterium lactis TaxID=1241981 RepID=A0A3G6RVX3_CHRLC|nr:hypothetical protein [Chryseobacterium lactis]AZA80678.1 hypothetical protein EG342_01550 [Chryseobacterium lactis]AZB05680.1 hypothetical protein EG341_17675 [Chryseobacterium lactis]PNW13601.1 hypothetical protein C1637_12390 [Chryseobacterium lactis]
MDRKLKIFLIKSFVVLAVIHMAYFIYGYVKFKGLQKINIYTEFYRFKFYDDVSISHFFVSGLFLFFFVIFLLRNHSKKRYELSKTLGIGIILLLVSFFSLTFFISYSFGLNAKLRTELPEKNLNKDKTLLNVLQPFLYNYTSYSSEKLFNPKNILYPKPYPVIEVRDTVYYEPGNKDYSSTESRYYSMDTLKMLTTDHKKLSNKAKSVLDILGLDDGELGKRIISKKEIGDSTEIIFQGREVHPQYDEKMCIFLESKLLFSPLHKVPERQQQYQNAVKRYNLLYKYSQDSLLSSFQKLDVLLKKYNIETQIVPKELTKDVFYYRDHQQEPLNAIRNTYERNELKDKFATLDRLFYKPNYLHPSISGIFIGVVISVWLILFLLYLIWNFWNRKPSPDKGNGQI